ncbi:MAG: terminase small subunit [Ignavibacteria bacterium]|jgi:phage terminase small subunit
MADEKLTVTELRYRQFAIELLATARIGKEKSFNLTKAYKTVYGDSVSDATANVNASKLLKNAKVKKYLNEYTKKFFGNKEKYVKKLLAELKEIAHSDITNYLEWRTESQVVGLDPITGQEVYAYRPIIELKDSVDVNGKLVKSVSLSKEGVFKFEMYDKQKAQDILSKIYEIQNDVTVKPTIVNNGEGNTTVNVYLPAKNKLEIPNN